MVSSDTVVGIVGVVLLVGVMAGVFVYEYNNADATDSTDQTDPTDTTAPGPGSRVDKVFQGTLGADVDPTTAQEHREEVNLTQSATFNATVVWTTAAAGLATITVHLENADGVVATGTSAGDTWVIEAIELDAGTYALVVATQDGSPGGDLAGEYHAVYG